MEWTHTRRASGSLVLRVVAHGLHLRCEGFGTLFISAGLSPAVQELLGDARPALRFHPLAISSSSSHLSSLILT